MYAIQAEDNIAEDVSVLPLLAMDEESAFALMLASANEWISSFAPEGFDPLIINRPGPAIDIACGDTILLTYTTHRITGVFSIHGEFGLEVHTP